MIFCAYASREDGYRLKFHEFEAVSRETVLMELDRPPDYVEPEDHLFWLAPTEAGDRSICLLPADAFLKRPPDEHIERRRRYATERGWLPAAN